MRQLFLVSLIFILSLLGLVALFNTITNTSKQSNIALATGLPSYPESEKRLKAALEWSSNNDSTGHIQLEAFYQWIQQEYPILFDNPNIEWQEFGPSNWVAKWVGRKADLAPIVWMASPEVAVPTATQQAVWEITPIPDKGPFPHIHGKGSQEGKVVMVAMLEVLHGLVTEERLPDRTIYFAFPFPAQTGEEQILKALAQAEIPAEYILQTGSFIAEELLWDLSAPVALLGVGQQAQAEITIVKASSKVDWPSFITHLQDQLNTLDLEHPVAKQFLQQLTPELPFQKRFVFSNSWLLDWRQNNYFYPNSLPHHLVGVAADLLLVLPNSDTAVLKITAPHLSEALLNTIQEWLKEDSVAAVSNWRQQQERNTAEVGGRPYRLLSNTCKEVFPNLITAPIWVAGNNTSSTPIVATPVFYFQPIVHNNKSWESLQMGKEQAIQPKNYERLLQFYHQLLTNSI